jgi:indolepyruvate ferredoxin oxidoreductase beta subunit
LTLFVFRFLKACRQHIVQNPKNVYCINKMKCDCILAGVGGQGVLSIAAIIASAAAGDGCFVRQSEVHGMAQRGGAVLAHLRLSGTAVACDLVPRGGADLIISMEPLESLRYLAWLSPEGALVSSSEPLVNIPAYPEPEQLYAEIRRIPRAALVDASAIAKEAGLPRAVNMVMIGAASPHLPISVPALETAIQAMFAAKSPDIARANVKAFTLGRKAAENAGA